MPDDRFDAVVRQSLVQLGGKVAALAARVDDSSDVSCASEPHRSPTCCTGGTARRGVVKGSGHGVWGLGVGLRV